MHLVRVAFGHKTCAVYLDTATKDLLTTRWPEARWSADYDPRLRALKLTAKTTGRGSTIHRQTKTAMGRDVFVLGWERDALPAGGRRFPTFAVLQAEDIQLVPDGVLVIIPPENKRQPAPIVRRRTKEQLRLLKESSASHQSEVLDATRKRSHLTQPTQVEPTSEPSPRKLDLLDALRHHRDALNNLRARHPEIGFRVSADGRLTVELLLTE